MVKNISLEVLIKYFCRLKRCSFRANIERNSQSQQGILAPLLSNHFRAGISLALSIKSIK